MVSIKTDASVCVQLPCNNPNENRYIVANIKRRNIYIY